MLLPTAVADGGELLFMVEERGGTAGARGGGGYWDYNTRIYRTVICGRGELAIFTYIRFSYGG